MLINEKVLTLRLSIIVYRLSTWEFDAHIDIVDKFYSQDLLLGNIIDISIKDFNYISRDLVVYESFQGYDLRNTETKQIQIAKNIIKNQNFRYNGEFDKETIHEITNLSYEDINKLIFQGGYQSGK